MDIEVTAVVMLVEVNQGQTSHHELYPRTVIGGNLDGVVLW